MQSRLKGELEQKYFNKRADKWFYLIFCSLVAGFMLGHIIAYLTL